MATFNIVLSEIINGNNSNLSQMRIASARNYKRIPRCLLAIRYIFLYLELESQIDSRYNAVRKIAVRL